MFDPFVSARSVVKNLRDKHYSAQELLEWQLKRIDTYNPELNAIVTTNVEQARQRAFEADTALARGVLLGPLHGLPLTIKDSIEVAGLPTTAGAPERAHTVSSISAPLAQSLLDAGALLLGKTNLPPYATDWQTNNPLFGRTNNPWDLSRTPGGSTGGGAAALAAGLTMLEFGSDLSGSLRIPPAFCGLYGHRPSENLVPSNGHIPGSELPNPAIVMNIMGPLARYADDLELALSVIAQPLDGEDIAWRLQLPEARHKELKDFRIAILPRPDWLPVDAELLTAFDDLTTRLRHAGAQIEEVQPEGFDFRTYHQAYTELLSVIAFTQASSEERQIMTDMLQRSSEPFAQARIVGINATVKQFLSMHAHRQRWRAIFRHFFQRWDIILTPVTVTPAFPHIDPQIPMLQRTLQINGSAVPYTYLSVYPGIAAYNGLPATTFPWGFTEGGLPIGFQAIGPYVEDYTTISFAAQLEQEYGGFIPPHAYQG